MVVARPWILLPVEIDDKSFDVEIEFSFDASNGMLRATFTSLDRELGLPPDVLTGFLPPEDGTGIGQGYFDFVAQTVSGLPTGTEIRNIAEIGFDGEAIIATNQIDPLDPSKGTSPDLEALVTIDADAPESAIAPAATTTGCGEILLVWSGQDGEDESGIRDYTIYVSEGGAEPVVWLDRTTDTQATFAYELDRVYSFYSVARDNAGNFESEPFVFDLNVVGGPAPRIEQVVVNGGDQQRSIVTQATVVFDRIVQVDQSEGAAVELLNVDTGHAVSVQETIGITNNKTVIDLAFLPGPSVGEGGTLLDGNYQLRVSAEGIIGNGLVMDGDGNGVGGDDFVFGAQAADQFFRFFGDSDGDRDVDGQDYGRFGLSFLKSADESGFNPIFDFDDDGDVDGQDYGQFGLNFLRQV